MTLSPLPPASKSDVLPVEILTQIFKSLPQHPRALAQLCRVCKTFRFVASELLYNDIVIHIVNESAIDPLIMKCLLYAENFGVTYIRNITVWGNIRSDLKKFDKHTRRFEPEREDGCSPTITNMALVLCIVLDKIPHSGEVGEFCVRLSNQNQGLGKADALPTSWDVNSFFSWMLTDKLQERHPHLKVLQLRDGDDGPWDRPWVEMIEFSNLQSLGWANITTYEVLVSLGALISSNSQTIKSLSISLRCFELLEADYRWELDGMYEERVNEDSPDSFLFRRLFETSHLCDSPTAMGNDRKQQLGLERLMLEKCPLDDPAHGFLSNWIDLSNLRALSLRRCPDTCRFLESWVASTDAIKLKSLELLLETDSEGIVLFLHAFTGLENLYLLLENLGSISPTNAIFESIYHHEETLRRLVVDFKRHGKTADISAANVMGIKERLRIRELGIALGQDEGRGDSGLELLCAPCDNQTHVMGTIRTIHIRNLLRPTCETFDDLFVDASDFFGSETFRHRKADAEAMIRPLDFRYMGKKAGNLEAVIIGPVDEGKTYESLGAATEFSCFLVDYVKTRVGRGLPVLNPVSMGDLRYFEVPCDVTKVQW